MASYEIRFRKSVATDLRPVPTKDVRKIIEAIQRLAADPRPPQSLKLTDADQYRLRCGAYRVLYEIHDDQLIVCIVKVGHRREVYRR